MTYWIDDCQCLNGFLSGNSFVPTRLHLYSATACQEYLNWWQCDVIGLAPVSDVNTIEYCACRPLSRKVTLLTQS